MSLLLLHAWTTISEERPHVGSILEERLGFDSISEETANTESISEKTLNIESISEKTPNIESILGKTPKIESISEKMSNIESISGKTPNIESISEKTPNIESISEKTPHIARLTCLHYTRGDNLGAREEACVWKGDLSEPSVTAVHFYCHTTWLYTSISTWQSASSREQGHSSGLEVLRQGCIPVVQREGPREGRPKWRWEERRKGRREEQKEPLREGVREGDHMEREDREGLAGEQCSRECVSRRRGGEGFGKDKNVHFCCCRDSGCNAHFRSLPARGRSWH